MKINPTVLIVAFALSTVFGVLSNSYLIESSNLMRAIENNIFPLTTEPTSLPTLVLMLNPIVSPLLVFVSFYFIGKKIQTNTEFYSYFLSFFLGNAIGYTFGSSIIIMLIQTIIPMTTLAIVARVVGTFVGSLFSSSFFVGLSALSLSYIIKKSQKSQKSTEI